MATLSEFFYQLIIQLIILMLELMEFIQKLKSDTHQITTRQYLKFIEEKNPTVSYTKRLKQPNQHEECAVCLSEFKEGEKVRKLKCKHTFHKHCLDKWLQEYWATCPYCRGKLLPDEVVSKQLEKQVDDLNENNEQPLLLSALRGGNSFHIGYL